MDKYINNSPLTVLVVDDSLISLVAQAHLLRQFGFLVVTATVAEEAMQILQHSLVDFVITDIEMPGMRGDELAYEIHKKYPEMPVIAATIGNFKSLTINEKARFHKILMKPLTQEKVRAFSLKQQKQRCMAPTRVTAVKGPNGKRIFLGSAFPGVYLTEREAELGIFLADYKYHEIAGFMKVSARTAEYYAANIKKKLHCSNKRQLVYVLKNSGIVEQLRKLLDFSQLLDKKTSV